MRHLLSLLTSILFLSTPIFGQSERPETIIIPVSGIGDVSNTRKLILENTLTDELKKHFRIVPQDKYEEVKQEVFQELEVEECNFDTCIMKIQEALQVENVFNLQIIGEGQDSQLNLKWITLDEKQNEEELCEACGTRELRKMIGTLVEKLVGKKDSTEEEKRIAARKEAELERKRQENERKRLAVEHKEAQLREERQRIASEKKRIKDESKKRQKSQSYEKSDTKFRGLIGSGSSGQTSFRNSSLYFITGKWGFGLSNFTLETTSSRGHKFEIQNQSFDFTYDYMEDITLTSFLDDTTLTLGIGIITSGEIKSSALSSNSSEASGYRFIGYLAENFDTWELLFGYHRIIYSYESNESENPSGAGGTMVFGLGIGF